MTHQTANYMKPINQGRGKFPLAPTLTALALCCASVLSAQTYTYTLESFEGSEWTTKAAEITAPTGKWTSNKNIASSEQAHDGSVSLKISDKAGLITPELTEGVGTLIYWAYDQNRQVNVEVSSDKTTWKTIESYKESTDWTKHSVEINDPAARYVRISTTSNNQFYIDDILLTRPDGTSGTGEIVVTSLNLPYFTHTFENTDTYPDSKETAESEKKYNVEGEGEWIYLNAYRATNASYIPDGSGHDLRLLKNGSYIISPVLTQGVVKVGFQEGRTGRKVNLYVSTDEGKTWTLSKEIATETNNEVRLDNKEINRIKLANESGSDADIDNFYVCAFPVGTPATVVTGDASEITSSTATVKVEVTDPGTGKFIEAGACWSLTGEPTINDNAFKCTPGETSVKIFGMSAASAINYRAYALTLAGVAYGEVKTLTTSGASLPKVTTGDIAIDEKRTTETEFYAVVTGSIDDNGGEILSESGVCFASTEAPTVEDEKETAKVTDTSDFSVVVKLLPSTEYHFRAFATNSSGTAYGEEVVFTTPDAEIAQYPHNIYYCDPEGDDKTADGSKEKPFYSLQLAVDKVVAGDIILMNPGTYKYTDRINVPTVGAKGSGMITLRPTEGRAILDFSSQSVADANQGMRITGSYWHIYAIDICNAGDNGMLIEREKKSGEGYTDIANRTDQAHDNIIEFCNFYRNADTGLQMKNLATFNKVLNCDSYYNIDPGQGNADGFAVKISHGDGNYFYGCRAWQNSDDGWDQFIKKEGGFPDDITTTLEDCWAFANGYLEDGSKGSGNGNGFKMGSNQGRNNIVMNRCLAFENLNKGFDQNHNTGHMILNNCTGYAAKLTSSSSHYTYRLDEATAEGRIIRLTNCVAVSDGIADRNKSAYAPHSVVGELVTSDMNTLPEDYVSIDPSGAYAERKADGSLPDMDFMKIKPGNTKLIDAGTEVEPFSGEHYDSFGISFNGSAPDLGCFETEESGSSVSLIKGTEGSRRLSIVQANCGLVVISVEGVGATEVSHLEAFNLAGNRLLDKSFSGATTSVSIDSKPGDVVILRATGSNLSESAKIIF